MVARFRGSKDLCLAVLTDSKLLVYNTVLAEESTEYGTPIRIHDVHVRSAPL